MPKPRREQVYNANTDQYRAALHEGAELDRERQQMQRRISQHNVALAERGVHPGAAALGKKIMRIRDLAARRQYIDACAKVLIDCDDDLMANVGHNAPPDEPAQEVPDPAPFGQQRRTAAA